MPGRTVFLVMGIYLLVFSDIEIWPLGNQSFCDAITYCEEDLHKVFEVILLGLAAVEIQRIRKRITVAWGAWVFPVFT